MSSILNKRTKDKIEKLFGFFDCFLKSQSLLYYNYACKTGHLTGPWQEAELLSGWHSGWQATHTDSFAYSRTDLQHKRISIVFNSHHRQEQNKDPAANNQKENISTGEAHSLWVLLLFVFYVKEKWGALPAGLKHQQQLFIDRTA